jgi:hypothetical protein
VTQLPQGFGLNLSDTFAGHFEILTDFFQSMVGGFTNTDSLPEA